MKKKISPMLESLHQMFWEIENSRDMFVDRVEMDATHFANLRRSCAEAFDASTHKEVLQKGMMGHLWTAEVYVGAGFGEPQVFGRDELPPESTLWIRRGWEKEA